MESYLLKREEELREDLRQAEWALRQYREIIDRQDKLIAEYRRVLESLVQPVHTKEEGK